MWCIKHEIWLNGQLALVQVVALTDKCHKDCYERYEHEDNPATNSKLRKRDDDKHNAGDYCTNSVQQRLLLPICATNIAPVHHHACLTDGESKEDTDRIGRNQKSD